MCECVCIYAYLSLNLYTNVNSVIYASTRRRRTEYQHGNFPPVSRLRYLRRARSITAGGQGRGASATVLKISKKQRSDSKQNENTSQFYKI